VTEIYELKLLIRTLFLPPAGPLIVAVIGLFLAWRGHYRKAGQMICATGLAALWLLATPAVSGQLMKWGRIHPVLDLRQPVDASAIVILAGGSRRYAPEYNDEAPNEITLQRLAYGVRVARVTGLPVLVTGGRGEARVMRDFLVRDFELVPRWTEEEAANTRENARFSAEILAMEGITRIVLVTSSLHMPRAVSEFQSVGLEVVPAPVAHYSPPDGIAAKWVPGIAGLRDSRNALYELLASAAYAVTGR